MQPSTETQTMSDTQTLSEPFALALCSLVDIFADQRAPARERVQAASKLLDVSQSLALLDRDAIIAEVNRIRTEKAMQAANDEALEPLARLMKEYAP